MSDGGTSDSISSEVRQLKEQLAVQTRLQQDELSLRKTLVAEGVDQEQKRGRAARRRTVLTLVAVLPLVAGVLTWSGSIIREQQSKEVTKAKREQAVDFELKSLSTSSKTTATKLKEHEKDFVKFRENQRLERNLDRWERSRHTDMLESALRGMGRPAEDKEPGHIQAERDAGLLR